MSKKKNKLNNDSVPKYSLNDKGKQLLYEYDHTTKDEFTKQLVVITVVIFAVLLFILVITSPSATIQVFSSMSYPEELSDNFKTAISLIFTLGRYLMITGTIVMYLYIVFSIVTYNLNRDAWIKYFLYFRKKN